MNRHVLHHYGCQGDAAITFFPLPDVVKHSGCLFLSNPVNRPANSLVILYQWGTPNLLTPRFCIFPYVVASSQQRRSYVPHSYRNTKGWCFQHLEKLYMGLYTRMRSVFRFLISIAVMQCLLVGRVRLQALCITDAHRFWTSTSVPSRRTIGT